MTEYRPPFETECVTAVARSRGLLKENESMLEGIERVASALAALDAQIDSDNDAHAPTFHRSLLERLQRGQLAVSSQLFAAAGRNSAVAACTVLSTRGTTDASRLRRVLTELEGASNLGMGCGMDVSDFEDPSHAVHQINIYAQLLNQRLRAQNRRPPALMITCSGQHPRIRDFIQAKRGADLGSWVANISVRLSGDQKEWDGLKGLVAACAHGNGEPGVLFQNEADADNPTPQLLLTSTAPCAEVYLSEGERCVFVTVNVAAHVRGQTLDWDAFDRSVRIAVRAGDAAVDLATVGASHVVAGRRRIGIGICGFHTALIMMGRSYALSGDLARTIGERLTFAAHSASAALAVRRGPFPLFSGSRWEDHTWLARKSQHRVGAVSQREWDALHTQILRTGIRNAAVVAYPPTGVVAEVLGVSRSYEPHFSLVGRTGIASRARLRVVPEVVEELERVGQIHRIPEILDPVDGFQLPEAAVDDVLACARQLPPAVHLEMHQAFCALADEAGSKTVNLPQAASIADIEHLLEDARAAGLKGLTVFRDGCLDEPIRRTA